MEKNREMIKSNDYLKFKEKGKENYLWIKEIREYYK
jgi:hypothetical protein